MPFEAPRSFGEARPGSTNTSDDKQLVARVLSQVGVSEEGGENRGPKVRRWLGELDLPAGVSWCGAFLAAQLDAAGVACPDVRSAWALDYDTEQSVPVEQYVRFGEAPPVGSLAVYRRGEGGHVGVVVESTPKWIETVSGNTSDPDGGPRDGVHRKRRSLAPASGFRPFAFTPVTYSK